MSTTTTGPEVTVDGLDETEVVPTEEIAVGRAARRRAVEPEATTTRRLRLPRRRTRTRARRTEGQVARARAIAMSLSIVALLCLCFVGTVTVLGALKEHRDQKTAYDDFRYELANGTAAVGQTDENGALLAPGTSVAVLAIPELGLDGVVLEGTTSAVLESGPGHRRDTVLPGQVGVSVVYGRKAAFGGPFSRLASLAPGTTIKAVTGQGESTYKVVDVRRAGQPVPALEAKGRLVLVTADGDPYLPTGIVAVDADLVTEAFPANPKVVTAASLTSAEQPLQGDPSAWIGLLLWAQALLLASLALVWSWARWGRWETWLVGVPVMLALGVAASAQAAQLLPNLI
jgi:LPXTG-site transpeptidase (sortase) family protein